MANVASRAVAAANDIRALGFKGEILIECCNAVNLCLGYAELFRKIRESFLGQVAVVCLNFLKNGNGVGFIVIVFFQNFIEHVVIELFVHFPSPY